MRTSLIKQTFRNEVDSLENKPVGEIDTFSYEWHRTKTRFGTEEKGQLRNCLLAEEITPLISTKTSEKLSSAVWSTRVLMWSYSILRYKVTTYMGPDFKVYIASFPLYPTNFEQQVENGQQGWKYGCAKLINRRESLYPSPPLQYKRHSSANQPSLNYTIHSQTVILFCFVFLFFREQNLIQPISRQFANYELSARLVCRVIKLKVRKSRRFFATLTFSY